MSNFNKCLYHKRMSSYHAYDSILHITFPSLLCKYIYTQTSLNPCYANIDNSLITGITDNSNDIITNLTGNILTKEQKSIPRFGLKHNLAKRPKETKIIATTESICQPLTRNSLLPSNFLKKAENKKFH